MFLTFSIFTITISLLLECKLCCSHYSDHKFQRRQYYVIAINALQIRIFAMTIEMVTRRTKLKGRIIFQTTAQFAGYKRKVHLPEALYPRHYSVGSLINFQNSSQIFSFAGVRYNWPFPICA